MIETSVSGEHRHDTRERSRRGRFGQQIRQLVLSRNVNHRNERPLDQILNNHKPQFKMLRPVAKLARVIGELPCGRVIFVSPNRLRRKANFSEELTYEASLVSTVSSSYDLGLAAALCNNRLALAFPRGWPAIEVKDHASRGFPSIFAVSPGSIGKEKEAVGQRRVIVARVPNAVQWVTLKVNLR